MSIRDDLDYYPTPAWAVRVMLKHVEEFFPDRLGGGVFEPCHGFGNITSVLKEEGFSVRTNDINPESNADLHRDYIEMPEGSCREDWVITNPPYNTPAYHAADFVRKALNTANVGVAMLLRLSFKEPCDNRFNLLNDFPHTLEQVIPRPRYVNGNTDSVTSVWLIWVKGEGGEWLPMQEDGIDVVPPEARPPVEEREIPTLMRDEDHDREAVPKFMEGLL